MRWAGGGPEDIILGLKDNLRLHFFHHFWSQCLVLHRTSPFPSPWPERQRHGPHLIPFTTLRSLGEWSEPESGGSSAKGTAFTSHLIHSWRSRREGRPPARFAQILYYYISRRKRAKVKRSFGCGLLSVPFGSSYRKTWVSEWVTKNRVNGANDERGEGKKGRHSLPYITSGPVPSVFASQSHDGTGCREVMMIENLNITFISSFQLSCWSIGTASDH